MAWLKVYWPLRGKPTDLIEHVLELVLSQRGALDVFDSSQILRHAIAVLLSYGLHLLLGQLLSYARVIAQVSLGSYDQAWNSRAVVMDLGEPFLADVFEGSRRCDGETDEEHISLRV